MFFKSAALYILSVAHLRTLPLAEPRQLRQEPAVTASLEKEQNDNCQACMQKISTLESCVIELTQKNSLLETQLKAAPWNKTKQYGLLGATIMVSTFAAQCALGFIEPQHTPSYWGIAADALLAASCGYAWSLLGYMHNPKSLRDETKYRSKIIPGLCAAFGGLGSTIALGNAFVTTKGYNQALFCGGIMMITPLVVSAGWHWWQRAKEQQHA